MDIFMSEDMHSSFVCCILSGGKYPHYTLFSHSERRTLYGRTDMGTRRGCLYHH